MRNERLIKRGHLKNFVKKEGAPENRPEERKEPTRERTTLPVNDGSSGTINMIVKEEANQSLRTNKKRR